MRRVRVLSDMLRDEPTIRSGLYFMPDKPIGSRILIPAFRQAISVRGAFGWFSVGWISHLAPGLATYLNRDQAAPMTFTVSPEFFPNELAAATEAVTMTPEQAQERIRDVFIDGRATADALSNHALDCLVWMIAQGKLNLRVVVPHEWSNFHPKMWWFEDGVHQLFVRGSGNATLRGIARGIEHMDVDITWSDESRARLEGASGMFEQWASGRSPGIASVHDLSDAIREQLVRTAPDLPPTEADYMEAVREVGSPTWAVAGESVGPRYQSLPLSALRIPDGLDWTAAPFNHQTEAVEAWEAGQGDGGEGHRGILAMATGAGKTITALIIASRLQDRLETERLTIVISAPSTPLIRQWGSEVSEFGVDPVTPTLASGGTNNALTSFYRRMEAGGTNVVIVTNQLLSDPAFQAEVGQAASRTSSATLLIADEAHTLGAVGFRRNKPEFFDYRVGLSATPERQYDSDGTAELLAFFGSTAYEFGLDRAIGFCLVPYHYHVHAAALSGDELDDFVELSVRIGAKMGAGTGLDDEGLTALLIQRRRIIETGDAKIALLRRVLEIRRPRSLRHALIYASSKNPEQFEAIKSLLDELRVVYAEVTQDQTSDMATLGSTFVAFEKGDIHVLLAKRVLDEGIDIPSIREAFLVASSTVEREWVQRRGRILRRSPGKESAVLHDFLALPPASIIRSGAPESVRKVVLNELGRAATFARYASNTSGEEGAMAVIARLRQAYWDDDVGGDVIAHPGDMTIAPDTDRGRLR